MYSLAYNRQICEEGINMGEGQGNYKEEPMWLQIEALEGGIKKKTRGQSKKTEQRKGNRKMRRISQNQSHFRKRKL